MCRRRVVEKSLEIGQVVTAPCSRGSVSGGGRKAHGHSLCALLGILGALSASERDLKRALDRILGMLRAQYTLAYYKVQRLAR
jgi:hypothetical protein